MDWTLPANVLSEAIGLYWYPSQDRDYESRDVVSVARAFPMVTDPVAQGKVALSTLTVRLLWHLPT